jgi:hypothetical protein
MPRLKTTTSEYMEKLAEQLLHFDKSSRLFKSLQALVEATDRTVETDKNLARVLAPFRLSGKEEMPDAFMIKASDSKVKASEGQLLDFLDTLRDCIGEDNMRRASLTRDLVTNPVDVESVELVKEARR